MAVETRIFAIKLPRREKEAMDFTARETGETLSAMCYRAIQNTVYEALGGALLKRLERRVEDETMPDYARGIPRIVYDFLCLMDEKEVKEEFRYIFKRVHFLEKEWLLYEVNLPELQEHMGRTYLERGGGFDEINIRLVRDSFFDHMLHTVYRLTATGLLKELDEEWKFNLARVSAFRDFLMKRYDERFKDEAVEAIEVGAAQQEQEPGAVSPPPAPVPAAAHAPEPRARKKVVVRKAVRE